MLVGRVSYFILASWYILTTGAITTLQMGKVLVKTVATVTEKSIVTVKGEKSRFELLQGTVSVQAGKNFITTTHNYTEVTTSFLVLRFC